ncbi:MAG: hypothetical protein LLG04_06595, partial [Parachlamydia sp.]|nr:hypothetical protein [Parachlamydia sp.]
EKGPPWLEIEGIVIKKDLTVEPSEQIDLKRPERVYTISVEDPAKVTWGDHFPTGVYVDQSLKQIFEKQCNPEIKIKYDWADLETQHKITAFSLPFREGVPADKQTSFYSFLMWILHKENGVWSYDYKKKSYTILGKKNKVDGKPLDVDEEWVVFPKLQCAPTPTFNSKKRKQTFDSVENKEENDPKAFKQVAHETLNSDDNLRYPQQSPDPVKSILIPQKDRLSLTFQKFHDFGLDQLLPGCAIKFLEKETVYWSSDACFKGKTFRVRELTFRAHKVGKTIDKPAPMESYRISLTTHLEEEDEPFIDRPFIVPPVYPFEIKGRIFCDVGDKEQSTYKIQKADDSPLGFYLVKAPLVEDGKNMVVPLAVNMPGHFYFPFGKDDEVVLDMYLHTADNIRPKGHQKLVQPPNPTGVQIHQIVLASNGKDEFTLLRHEFVDGKKSVFTIVQKASATETQTFQIQQQDISLCVEEKDKKKLFIQITKETGLTLSLEDKSAGVTQQTNFDGKAMTLSCKGKPGESKIVLKPDSIAIDCKTLSISVTEDFNVEAKNQVAMKGKNKIGLESSALEAAVKKAKLG